MDEYSPIQLIFHQALVALQEISLIKSLTECPDGSATCSNSFRMFQYAQIKKKIHPKWTSLTKVMTETDFAQLGLGKLHQM